MKVFERVSIHRVRRETEVWLESRTQGVRIFRGSPREAQRHRRGLIEVLQEDETSAPTQPTLAGLDGGQPLAGRRRRKPAGHERE